MIQLITVGLAPQGAGLPLNRKGEIRSSMKNAIPLVLAVVLGLMAVFSVSKMLSKKDANQHGQMVSVLVANGNLRSGGVISKEGFRSVAVPLMYAPKQHILQEQENAIMGQTLSRDVAAGDYLQWNDIGGTSSLGESVGEGEWAVTVTFENGDLVRMLKPGDEIAIVGMFDVREVKDSGSADVNAPKVEERKIVTTVLFPQVRIMGIVGRGGVLLSLPPTQALTVIAAQKEAKLYATLRRPHDEKSTNRKDSGMFDASAFVKMLNGCKEIDIPDQPFNKAK